jgi:hypothetical protein
MGTNTKTNIKTRDEATRINGMPCVNGFQPKNLTVLLDKGTKYVCAFDGEAYGKEFFHIRELYEEYGEVRPGKGVAVPLPKKMEFLNALRKYIAEQ